MPEKVTYFGFEGRFVKEDVDGEMIPVVGDEMQMLVDRMLQALNCYQHGDFRFVDIDSSGTLSDGRCTFNWSDHGLGELSPEMKGDDNG